MDTYEDPAGVTDHTWNKVNRLIELKDPVGKATSYAYDNNDIRTRTTCPGGTVHTVTPETGGPPAVPTPRARAHGGMGWGQVRSAAMRR